jgi:phytoene synthase
MSTICHSQTFSVHQAKVYTEDVIRKHSKTFYFATGLLPKDKRAAIRSLYAFCRTTDDLVDRDHATIADLENWQNLTNLTPDRQTNPVLYYWSKNRARYSVNRKFERELIDGVRKDLEKTRYQTWSDLRQYCYLVASTVGLLSMPIIGLADQTSFEQAAPYAITLGIALQMTNILRDISEDGERGRIYLPQEDLLRFGITNEDILNKVYDKRFMDLMKFQIQRARDLYRQALPGIRLLHPSVRLAVGASAILYRAILDEIEAVNYDVFKYRAHTSALKKIALLPQIILTVWCLPNP